MWEKLLVAPNWRVKLEEYLNNNFDTIINSVVSKSGNKITPDRENLFNAFNLCDLNKTVCVIIGQDPYPGITKSGHKYAHGLSFSYIPENENDKNIPKSLLNIFKEIRQSIYNNNDVADNFYNTNLTKWAEQGVLLLNSALTTETGVAGRHLKEWEDFYEKVCLLINDSHPVCIINMGNFAQKSIKYFTNPEHKIINVGHPSPLNTKQSFIDSDCFLEANEWIKKTYNQEIKW